MATWHTVETARDEWVDAPYDADDGDTILSNLLDVARDAVLAFAPAVETPLVDIPAGYRTAQLKAARNSWSDSKMSSGEYMDGGQFSIPITFIPWHQDVRPKRGVPVIA